MKKPLVYLFCGALLFAGRGAGALDFAESQTRHFTIYFAEGLSSGELRDVKDSLESAYTEMETRIGTATARAIDVVIFRETGDFTAETRLPFWSASAMIDGAIYLQPVRVLVERGVLESTVRHEVCLALLYRVFGNHPPLWFCEGLAVCYSGEIEILNKGLSGGRPVIRGPDDIDALLCERTDREKNRWGYVLAYERVKKIIEGAGFASARGENGE